MICDNRIVPIVSMYSLCFLIFLAYSGAKFNPLAMEQTGLAMILLGLLVRIAEIIFDYIDRGFSDE